MALHGGECEAHRVVEWRTAAWLVVVHSQRAGFGCRDFIEHLSHFATAKCHERHVVVLRVGEVLLRFFDTGQGLIESVHGGATYASHRAAAVEDNHVEHLRFFCVCSFAVFHNRRIICEYIFCPTSSDRFMQGK